MLSGIKGAFQISHDGIERSQFCVGNKFLDPFSPKLVSTLELASGLPAGSIEIDRHSLSEIWLWNIGVAEKSLVSQLRQKFRL